MVHDTTHVRDGMPFPDVQRALPLVVLVAVAVVLFYWPTSAWLASEWTSSNALFQHGFLTVAITAFLLARAAGDVPAEGLRPSWLAAAAVLGLSLAWLAANVANVAIVQSLLLPLLLLCALVAMFGFRAGRVLAPAVFYIVFALPIWEVLKPFLRDLTIVLVEALLRLGGVPVMIDGALVHIPAGTFRIATGCSGLNFFVVGLAMAALYGYVFYTSNRKRLLLLVIGAAMAMLTNWLRVASVIAIGNSTNMQSGLVEDHQMFGWILFVIMLVPFFAVAMWLGRHEPHAEQTTASAWAGPRVQRANLVAGAAVLLLLAVGPAWAALARAGYALDATASVGLPVAVSGWEGPIQTGSSWQPEYAGAAGEALGRYDSDAGSIWYYGNVYLSQDQDRELVYIHNRVGGDASVRSSATRKISETSDQSFKVRVVDVDEGFRLRRIVYWYEIDGQRVVSDLTAKLRQARAVLVGRPEAGVVAVSALCSVDCVSADERIADFIEALGGSYRLEYTVKDDSL